MFHFSETLFVPRRDSSVDETKNKVTALLSHEIAHQWFGNLVTPKWWQDLWLSEGISRYIEHLSLQSVSTENSKCSSIAYNYYKLLKTDWSSFSYYGKISVTFCSFFPIVINFLQTQSDSDLNFIAFI